MNMSNPFDDFGNIMDTHMKEIYRSNTTVSVELGTISGDMSLSVGSLQNAIPKGDYMVSLHLTVGSLVLDTTKIPLTTKEADEHKHSIDEHMHKITLPTQMRGLRAGDRVLVLWAGTEPVVVDIVVSS